MLFPGKIILGVAVAAIGMGFALGLLHWDTSKTRCFVSRNWDQGSWHTVYAIGKLQFRARDYGCDPQWQLDPSQWQKDSLGNITPKN